MFWVVLFLITLFIRPQDWPGCPLYGMPVNDIIVVGGLLYALAVKDREVKYFNIPQNFFILLFVLLAFLSNAAHGNYDMASEQFFKLFKRYIIYFMLLISINTSQKLNKTLFYIALMGVILSFQGIYQDITGVGWAMQRLHTISEWVTQESMGDITSMGTRIFWLGVWDGPNVLAIVFLFGVPYCLENIFRTDSKLAFRIFFGAFVGFLGYGVYLTNSRGGFLVFALMMLLFIVLRFKRKFWILSLVVFIPIVLLLAPARMQMMDSEEESASERTWLWEQGLNMFRESPVFGVGKGTFARSAGMIAHNNFVQNLGETGFAGLFVYIALMYLTLKSSWVVFKNVERNNELFSLARVIFITAAGFYMVTFFVVMELEIIYLLWALAASVFLVANKEKPETLKLKFGKVDVIAISSIAILIIILIWLIAEKEVIRL